MEATKLQRMEAAQAINSFRRACLLAERRVVSGRSLSEPMGFMLKAISAAWSDLILAIADLPEPLCSLCEKASTTIERKTLETITSYM